MARLRKAVSPTEPSILFPPSTEPRATRSSPRKSQRESPSKRELRYTSQDSEESILVPKLPAAQSEAPRKQRILRPVGGNGRLLKKKISNESIASSDRKERLTRERDNGLGYLYSRSLARTVAKREIAQGKPIADKNIEIPAQRKAQKITAEKPVLEETALDEDESEVDQSLWCGDEEGSEEPKAEPEGQEHEDVEEDVMDDETEEDGDGDEAALGFAVEEDEFEEEEDDDPVVDVRTRRRQVWAQPKQRRQVEETDEEPEEDLAQINAQRQQLQADQQLQDECAEEKQEPESQPEPQPAEEMPPPLKSLRPPHRKGRSTISNWAGDVIDLTSSPEPPASFILPPPSRPASFAAMSRPTTSSSNDEAAVHQYLPTPTKQQSPRKAPPLSRPSTPPLPPASPSKLVSPSKKKIRIPDAPNLRPSLDAFWAADVVNDWNETHSPTKPLISPRKQKLLKEIQQLEDSSDSDASFTSPVASPRKKKPEPIGTPSVAVVRAQRKAFADSKHALAESFLSEIDTTITGGRIGLMSANTGGIKLVWSKTLKTTAGRANWRRETMRLRIGPEITDIKTEIRHHCSIELAEKVIDDEERLYNVLAHEYCHLTTFMISEIRNNPHGAEFKAWAAKVSRAFKHKAVEVTTKHSYQIAYKYVWECVTCGYEFKRHSKSVDTTRHSCGRCKGKLVQTKPVPRAGKGDGKPKEKSEYQLFVKANFSKVKKRLVDEGKDAKLGNVMAVVAEEYRLQKGSKKETTEKGFAEVEDLFENLRIQDDGL